MEITQYHGNGDYVGRCLQFAKADSMLAEKIADCLNHCETHFSARLFTFEVGDAGETFQVEERIRRLSPFYTPALMEAPITTACAPTLGGKKTE